VDRGDSHSDVDLQDPHLKDSKVTKVSMEREVPKEKEESLDQSQNRAGQGREESVVTKAQQEEWE